MNTALLIAMLATSQTYTYSPWPNPAEAAYRARMNSRANQQLSRFNGPRVYKRANVYRGPHSANWKHTHGGK